MAFRLFFSTELGHKVIRFGTGATAIGFFLGNWVPHTYLLEKYKDIMQHYSEGVGMKVEDDVIALTQEVMDTMKMTEGKQKHVHFFTVFGFDVFHAGSLMLRSGAQIGLPVTFGNSAAKVMREKKQIMVNKKPLPWGTPAVEVLLKSLVLSKDAQKFVIARELSHIEKSYVYWNAVLPCVLTISTYAICHWLNSKLKLHKKPPGLRLFLYTVVALQGFAFWAFLKDNLTCFDESRADKEACALGESYIKGAVEFYQMQLKRNIALRELEEPFGKKYYTAYGNLHVMLRTKHIPITTRLQNVKELMKQQEKIFEKTEDAESLKTI